MKPLSLKPPVPETLPYQRGFVTVSVRTVTMFPITFKSNDLHLPADWDLATLPNKSFVS
jgi:hypothetical protein